MILAFCLNPDIFLNSNVIRKRDTNSDSDLNAAENCKEGQTKSRKFPQIGDIPQNDRKVSWISLNPKTIFVSYPK